MGISSHYQQILSENEKSELLTSLRKIRVVDKKSSLLFSKKVEEKKHLLSNSELGLLSLKLFFYEKCDIFSDKFINNAYFTNTKIPTGSYSISVIKKNSDLLHSILSQIQSENYYYDYTPFITQKQILDFDTNTLRILILDFIYTSNLEKGKWVEYSTQLFDIIFYSKRCHPLPRELESVIFDLSNGLCINEEEGVATSSKILPLHKRKMLLDSRRLSAILSLISTIQ